MIASNETNIRRRQRFAEKGQDRLCNKNNTRKKEEEKKKIVANDNVWPWALLRSWMCLRRVLILPRTICSTQRVNYGQSGRGESRRSSYDDGPLFRRPLWISKSREFRESLPRGYWSRARHGSTLGSDRIYPPERRTGSVPTTFCLEFSSFLVWLLVSCSFMRMLSEVFPWKMLAFGKIQQIFSTSF